MTDAPDPAMARPAAALPGPGAAAPSFWRGPSAARLRIWTGLILFAFALTHFLNIAAGLLSFEAMQTGREWRVAFTRSTPGTGLLILAAAVHAGLGIATLFRTRTWRIGYRSITQLLTGLLIPIFMIRHVLDTRGAHEMFGIRDDFAYALWGIWPNEALNQALLMAVVWVHSCIGLHHWLGGRAWYRRTTWLWYGLAVLVPALAYAGFVTAARAFKATGVYRNPFKGDDWDRLVAAIATSEAVYFGVIGASVAIWIGLMARDRLQPRIAVTYASGTRVNAVRGMTLLDVSRANRIPHASVCGGRARCSTCRVRVVEGQSALPPPSATEIQVLQRVGAPPNVRLACQARPTASVTISPLLPAQGTTAGRVPMDRYHWGVEQEVTVLFCDLRGFTRLSEGKLPFDVVFLLNQFLGRMAEAIEDTGGFVDKFMGDGIMAIFGIGRPTREGALQAVAAARAMGGVLAALNQSLREDLAQPLAMGIGIHTGPAILGRIGAASRGMSVANLTALGETVNIASRLEAMTKDLGVEAILSSDCIVASGLRPGTGVGRHSLTVRGKSTPVDAFAAARATDLPTPVAVEGRGARNDGPAPGNDARAQEVGA